MENEPMPVAALHSGPLFHGVKADLDTGDLRGQAVSVSQVDAITLVQSNQKARRLRMAVPGSPIFFDGPL